MATEREEVDVRDYGFGFDIRVRRKQGSGSVELTCTPPLPAVEKLTALSLGIVLICKQHDLDLEVLWESMRQSMVESANEMRGKAR